MGIHWDGTVTLGTIFTIITMVSVTVGAVYSFKSRIDRYTERQTMINAEYATLIEKLTMELRAHSDKDEVSFKQLQTELTQRLTDAENKNQAVFQTISTRITDLVGGVQRLIGQNEAFRSGMDRRGPHNEGGR